jgi:hypothetical protein
VLHLIGPAPCQDFTNLRGYLIGTGAVQPVKLLGIVLVYKGFHRGDGGENPLIVDGCG